MKSSIEKRNISRLFRIGFVAAQTCLIAFSLSADDQTTGKQPPSSAAPDRLAARLFDNPKQAADALVAAAAKFDVVALTRIFGTDGDDIVLTDEFPQDQKHAADFASEAREKMSVSVDPKTGRRAFILVGNEEWPFPVPLVKQGDTWYFDANAGRKELLYRRVGANELDAIQLCHGYVEAQYDYAFKKREGYDVNQFAQRIISTPGKQDGLAWQNQDGIWDGPIGEKVARAIEQGYTPGADPYHGYFFKILKGQGPAAPLGEMNFVIEGAMIGGFALVASPAEYGVSGVNTFVVSDDGVVYQKDFGPSTLAQFQKVELYNPDKSWTPVQEDDND